MLLFLIISLVANVVLLALFVHSRMAYHLMMKKSLRQEKLKDELVEKISFEQQSLADEQDIRVLDALKVSMENDKVFLDPDMNMQKLAKIVGTNKTTLSRLINSGMHKNFASLLNSYRIREAVQLLSDTRYRDYKIEAIGEMCGYGSRQVFHSAFKKEMGITPTHFRKISKQAEEQVKEV